MHKPGCRDEWGSGSRGACQCKRQANLTNLEVYIDDGSMQVKGPKGRVASLAIKAGRALGQAFEIGCGLPVSKKKTKVTASSARLGNQVAAGLGMHGCKRARAALILGVQHTAGQRGAQRQGRIRMNASEKRKRRFIRLKKLGAKVGNVVRAAGNLSVQYGAKAMGMTPSVLAKLRQTMAMGLPDRAKAASITLQFKLSGNEQWDPTFATVMAPVLFVSKLAFESAGVHSELQEAWKKQVVKQGRAFKSDRPRMAVSGPAGAMLHSLRRLEWQSTSAFKWSTDGGLRVDARVDAPSTIRRLLSESISRMLWKEWAAAPSAKQSWFKGSPLGYMSELIQEWTSISACEN